MSSISVSNGFSKFCVHGSLVNKILKLMISRLEGKK